MSSDSILAYTVFQTSNQYQYSLSTDIIYDLNSVIMVKLIIDYYY